MTCPNNKFDDFEDFVARHLIINTSFLAPKNGSRHSTAGRDILRSSIMSVVIAS